MSPRTRLLAVVVVVGIAGPARPEESQPAHVPGPADAAAYLRRIRAARRTGPIVLDGRMDEQAWEAAPWGDRFTQIEPDEAVPASVQTRFRVLWDDEAIYIGVECKDAQPPTARLSRRDRAPLSLSRRGSRCRPTRRSSPRTSRTAARSARSSGPENPR